MKKLVLLALILFPSLVSAQEKERHSRAYLGIMLHDMERHQLGLSLVNSFGVNQYLGIGAGVDITSYKDGLMVPVYADVRVKYPVNDFAPYALGQFGFQLYNNDVPLGLNMTGVPANTKAKGKYFYGVGIGASYKRGKVGFFLQYIQRGYHFKYTPVDINGRSITPENPDNIGILTAGLVF